VDFSSILWPLNQKNGPWKFCQPCFVLAAGKADVFEMRFNAEIISRPRGVVPQNLRSPYADHDCDTRAQNYASWARMRLKYEGTVFGQKSSICQAIASHDAVHFAPPRHGLAVWTSGASCLLRKAETRDFLTCLFPISARADDRSGAPLQAPRVPCCQRFAVSFEQDQNDPMIWFVDSCFIDDIRAIHRKAALKERIVGRSLSKPNISRSVVQGHQQTRIHASNPVLVNARGIVLLFHFVGFGMLRLRTNRGISGGIRILDAIGLLQQDTAASWRRARWCPRFINQSRL
jgi:hypothetical protein